MHAPQLGSQVHQSLIRNARVHGFLRPQQQSSTCSHGISRPQSAWEPSNSAQLAAHVSQPPTLAPVQAPRHVRTRAVAQASTQRASADTYKYRTLTKQGNLVTSVVDHTAQGASIEVSLEGYELEAGSPAPQLHWGLYRASGSQWYHPRDTVPPNSTLDSTSGGMRSPMHWNEQRSAWMIKLQVPMKLLPLQLALVFYYPDQGAYETPTRGQHFSIPIGMSQGDASQMGARVVRVSPANAHPDDATCNVNFAVVSRHATAMYLCLVRVQSGAPNVQGTGVLEIALDPSTNKTGDVWHVCVHGLRNISAMCYGWRADGDATWESGGRFHPGFILADPFGPRTVPVVLPATAYTGAPKVPPSFNPSQPVMLSSLAAFTQTFLWGGAHRPLSRDGAPKHYSLEEQVLVEIDIETFTQGADAERVVPPERRGKFLGVLDRLKDIVEGGATSVVLSPCCMTSSSGTGPWERHPISYMSPNLKYAMGGALDAAAELKTVIKVLHQSGVEVLLSVEYCLTGEGSNITDGGLQGLRGLDAQLYYRTLPDGTSVLSAGQPIVRQLVLESLRHWAMEYCVDGFCFVHAENMVQDQFGSILDNPPLAEEICHDPVLRGLKLIAAPGNVNLLPRGGIRGFPHWGLWQQLNDRFNANMYSWLVDNTPGMLSAVATRITGSADLFAPAWDSGLPGALAAGRRAGFSVNCIAPFGDKQLLKVLGGDDNLNRAEVLARTLLLAQFTSAGTPIVPASTFNRKGLWRFVAMLAALRRQMQGLINPPITFEAPAAPTGPVDLLKPPAPPPPPKREISWYGAVPGVDVDWQNTAQGMYPSNVLSYLLRDPAAGTALFVSLNPYDQPVLVSLPTMGLGGMNGSGGAWRVVVDTALMPPQDIDMQGPFLVPGQMQYEVKPKAGVLLVAVPAAPGM